MRKNVLWKKRAIGEREKCSVEKTCHERNLSGKGGRVEGVADTTEFPIKEIYRNDSDYHVIERMIT